ncbi:MAG: aldo/keto reductase, partial [Planctomycetota bacterium]
MRHRPLGTTGILVSEVGFGCWQLGGEGWGAFRTEDGIRAVRRALELGISLFDTAPVYGFGRSEELLGRALRGAAPDAAIVSKAGLVWDEGRRVAHDNRPESIARSLEGSLKRLGVERLDVLLLHWPDPRVPLEESIAELERLRSSGKIRAWGLSNHPAAAVLSVERALEDAARRGAGPVLEYPANAAQSFAPEYEESGRAGETLRPLAEARSWGFVAFDVLLRGILAGRWGPERRFGKRDLRRRDPRYRGAGLARSLEAARRVSAA